MNEDERSALLLYAGDIFIFRSVARLVIDGKSLDDIATALGYTTYREINVRLDRLAKKHGPLITREKYTKLIELTEAGSRLLQQIEGCVDRIRTTFDADQTSDVPHVTVWMNVPLLLFLPPTLFDRGAGIPPSLGFRAEFRHVVTRSDAADSIDAGSGQGEIGLVAAGGADMQVLLPRAVEETHLISSSVQAIFRKDDPRAKDSMARKNFQYSNLRGQPIIARSLYKAALADRDIAYRSIVEPMHSQDTYSYVEAGFGIGLNTAFGISLLGVPEGLAILPLEPAVKISVSLLRRKTKRANAMAKEVDRHLELLIAWYHKQKA